MKNNNKLRILAISDTHGFHDQFLDSDFKDLDMIIFAGDCSNTMSPAINANEVTKFLNWYDDIPVKYKIMIAGNHCTSIEYGLIKPNQYHKSIIYLEHESINIEGINIFGSPYTPRYGAWSFMKDKGKLDPYWEQIPENTDILVTHGPPKGILDLSRNRNDELEFCGDKELLNHVYRVKPKHHIFGHIHNFKDCLNKGSKTVHDISTQFHNVSCVTDAKFEFGLTSKGIRIEI